MDLLIHVQSYMPQTRPLRGLFAAGSFRLRLSGRSAHIWCENKIWSDKSVQSVFTPEYD